MRNPFAIALSHFCAKKLYVIVAESGNDALQRARHQTGEIQLLLSNVQMPGTTGIELAAQLQLERPKTAVLLVSGLSAGMIVLDTGWQFLPKPFLPAMLVEKIGSMLDRQENQNPPGGCPHSEE